MKDVLMSPRGMSILVIFNDYLFSKDIWIRWSKARVGSRGGLFPFSYSSPVRPEGKGQGSGHPVSLWAQGPLTEVLRWAASTR